MTAPATPPTYFRKGFGLKADVEGELAAAYDGRLVDLLKERDYSLSAGGVTVRLAREFGFCYGVERAVEYAYQTRKKFPDKKIYLAGEIIHNPHINRRLSDAGVIFLKHNSNTNEASFDFSIVNPEDVIVEMVPPNIIWRVTGAQMSERRRAPVRQLLTSNEADKGSVISYLPIPTNFEFPHRKKIFMFSWEGEDFDTMFNRLTDEYNEANPRAFAALDTDHAATQQLTSPPGQKDPITGFYG